MSHCATSYTEVPAHTVIEWCRRALLQIRDKRSRLKQDTIEHEHGYMVRSWKIKKKLLGKLYRAPEPTLADAEAKLTGRDQHLFGTLTL